MSLKSPYPWFGGKARVAKTVWRRFGDVKNYVEPFFGGGAVMLLRPHAPGVETVNDINAWLTNFWRAVKADPYAVAGYASDPVSELDLHARGDWLFYRTGVDKDFVERLRGDPDYYCVKSAGWWVWGQSSWIGGNWGRLGCRARPHLHRGKGVKRQLPHLGTAGTGVNRKLPHLADAGMGVNRKLPHLGTAGMGVMDTSRRRGMIEYFHELAERLCRVRICCGDWTRVLGPTPTFRIGVTGMFLDPPYAVGDRYDVYGDDESKTLAHDVREWAIANGDHPKLRIALCGYEGEHDMPQSWECLTWKAGGGYGSRTIRGTANAKRERVWFSPHCLRPEPSLFPKTEVDHGVNQAHGH